MAKIILNTLSPEEREKHRLARQARSAQRRRERKATEPGYKERINKVESERRREKLKDPIFYQKALELNRIRHEKRRDEKIKKLREGLL